MDNGEGKYMEEDVNTIVAALKSGMRPARVWLAMMEDWWGASYDYCEKVMEAAEAKVAVG